MAHRGGRFLREDIWTSWFLIQLLYGSSSRRFWLYIDNERLDLVGAILYDTKTSANHYRLETVMKKGLVVYLQSIFYFVAGVNHFVHPEFYLPLIPKYLPLHEEINVVAGIVEVLFGLGLLFTKSRRLAAYGIMLMLIAFIPSHVFFIDIGGCVEDGLCAPLWVGWVRLVLVHPLLILWAWKAGRC